MTSGASGSDCPSCRAAHAARRLRVAVNAAACAAIAACSVPCLVALAIRGRWDWRLGAAAPARLAQWAALVGLALAAVVLPLRVIVWFLDRRARRPGSARTDLAEVYRAPASRPLCELHPPAAG